ncbi:MAG TPA: hypothetical protein RMH85_31875 [Polyangiaceae bacterium LLY-WYZ-15_(1-7)]|nr:hypothetical protein [Polyangiaceae bacterium LLY-WYZ-15_(1-7)]HJL02563.1 hypothetical protein [Polyangiaceae bacterium LLY-WYZ-15_(1-7)]HJL13125.1 hypothetical protein [Polyangiaceae bacterium LLY-WYZ-15_(1-7)]HJL24726.1 hypothetical protein [Polyangiaceae bacterium LLY-WYZ-15_(1-7)]HJL31478.1 hypothetical protein [Polyangiaceae bacterium LLY-WYZ-15_(1-7)]
MRIRMGMWRVAACGLMLALFGGCELVVDFDRSRIPEGGMDAGEDAGTGEVDAGDDEMDAGEDMDAAMEDAGEDMDAAVDDAGMDDAGSEDAGPEDAGPEDAGEDAGPECTMASECDDSVDCTVDACTDGACVNTPDDAMCDDSDECTADMCDMTTGCANVPICGVDVSAGSIMLDDLTTIVVIPEVEAAVAGFIVIHEDDAGSPGGTTIGHAPVAAGVNTDVSVDLVRRVADGEVLHAMLHVDSTTEGTVGTYDGPGTDPPATLDGMIVNEFFTATVPAGTPDLEVTLEPISTMHYEFVSSRPSTFTAPSGFDPEWTLLRGFRYRVVNDALPFDHPFELVSDNADGGPMDDTEQLSQDPMTAGALEGDMSIDWDESDDRDVLFTVSPAFEVIDVYRCASHTGPMRGDIVYADF